MIDTKLIAAHQWVVDETQKKPGWWAEQAIMAATTLEIVRRVVTWESGWDAVLLLLCLVVCAMLVHASRNPILLKSIGTSTWVRPFFLILVVLQLFTLPAGESIAVELIELISSIGMLSYYCFAACDDPRPRKRKEKLVPTAA